MTKLEAVLFLDLDLELNFDDEVKEIQRKWEDLSND